MSLAQFWQEVRPLATAALGLSNVTVFQAEQASRIPWRQLLDEYEREGVGLNTPWLVIQTGPHTPEDWGLVAHAYSVPVTIFYIRSAAPTATTVPAGAASATQTVASASGFYVGQDLYFRTANTVRTITTIVGNVLTLNATVTTVNGEKVESASVPADVENALEPLRDAFVRGGVFTNFQVMEDPVLDASDSNPANVVFNEANFALYAGSVSFSALMGTY